METDKELKIYIADDHPIVVEGLKEVLKRKTNCIVNGIAHNGEQLVDLIKKEMPDLAIVDINMPIMNGIQCTEWIKKNYPAVKVIILTMYPEKTFVNQLIKAGADGCLLKSRGTIDLVNAIERVSDGKSYFDWIYDFKKEQDAKEYRLSEREIQIIKLIIDGKGNGEIAQTIFVSEDTVKTHRKNIFKKLNVHNASELMTFVLNNGVL
ncbi:MAG TPA: response regulator transcription factor [Cyclobacteriaceae bacterium]|jgi:DNA-binding NarL/FixJ family response regulator|nr:response regulator transcription factor [Cyclobacteriaceae bacterium]